jgi:Cu/Ag efflux pump CusA
LAGGGVFLAVVTRCHSAVFQQELVLLLYLGAVLNLSAGFYFNNSNRGITDITTCLIGTKTELRPVLMIHIIRILPMALSTSGGASTKPAAVVIGGLVSATLLL